LSSSDVEELAYEAIDGFEHKSITFYDRKGLEKVLDTYGETMSPAGRAAVELRLEHY